MGRGDGWLLWPFGPPRNVTGDGFGDRDGKKIARRGGRAGRSAGLGALDLAGEDIGLKGILALVLFLVGGQGIFHHLVDEA